ncbi:hypothetical protein [Streptomyces enissocaesilis]|uniref:Uncharacterized protein n=1 Tax=Streptomyces enissocaesilis TaxID=332589 RepID=A0ABN3WXU7_9ACTN
MPETTTQSASLIDLAITSYTEYAAEAMDQGDEMFEEHRSEFLGAARATAQIRLGAATELDWTYTGTMDLPPDTEEATAPLAPGRPEYLRYRWNADTEDVTFELVQPCDKCNHSQINEITGLVGLGALLAEGAAS